MTENVCDITEIFETILTYHDSNLEHCSVSSKCELMRRRKKIILFIPIIQFHVPNGPIIDSIDLHSISKAKEKVHNLNYRF